MAIYCNVFAGTSTSFRMWRFVWVTNFEKAVSIYAKNEAVWSFGYHIHMIGKEYMRIIESFDWDTLVQILQMFLQMFHGFDWLYKVHI